MRVKAGGQGRRGGGLAVSAKAQGKEKRDVERERTERGNCLVVLVVLPQAREQGSSEWFGFGMHLRVG